MKISNLIASDSQWCVIQIELPEHDQTLKKGITHAQAQNLTPSGVMGATPRTQILYAFLYIWKENIK